MWNLSQSNHIFSTCHCTCVQKGFSKRIDSKFPVRLSEVPTPKVMYSLDEDKQAVSTASRILE